MKERPIERNSVHPVLGASVKPGISEHDAGLLQRAMTMRPRYDEWYAVESMADEAESDDVRKRLHSIAMSMYHTEEYMAGCL